MVRLARKAQRSSIYQRESLPLGGVLTAPALIVEYGSTTLLSPGWEAAVDAWRNLILRRDKNTAAFAFDSADG
jgi:N-methylhydantoinase A/oxoprolinase/acetone carboxylase beta subunit